jgi:hypothetical protein
MSRRTILTALALAASFAIGVAVSNGPTNAIGQARPGRGKCVGVVVSAAATPAFASRWVYVYRTFEDGSVDLIKHLEDGDAVVNQWTPLPVKDR